MEKRALEPVSKYRGLGVYSMNKAEDRRKLRITDAKAAVE
jgi:hypothetical protein